MMLRVAGVVLLVAWSVAGQQPVVVTLEKEKALGDRLAADFLRDATLIESAPVQDFLGRMTSRLAAQMPDSPFPFDVRLVLQDRCAAVHEPVALPGGHIFISKALLLAVRDEAELAGMLASAMHRTVLRAPAATPGSVRIGSLPLILIGSDCRAQGGSTGQSTGALEQQADERAVPLLMRAGYAPAALLRYLERRAPAERVAALRAVIEKLPPVTSAPLSDELATLQAEIRPLLSPPDRPSRPPTLFQK